MSGSVGVVLTGGRSTRMGRDKATIVVDGKPMVVRVADALWEAGLHPVECQGGEVRSIEGYGLTVKPDDEPGAGPLAAMRTALARHPHDDVVIVACDLVDIDAETVAALAEAGGAHPDADVIAVTSGGRRHMASWWKAGSAERVGALLAEGVDAYQDALDRLTTVDLPVAEGIVRNLNSPADLLAGE